MEIGIIDTTVKLDSWLPRFFHGLAPSLVSLLQVKTSGSGHASNKATWPSRRQPAKMPVVARVPASCRSTLCALRADRAAVPRAGQAMFV